MRADRLLAEVLILQRRGRVTAAELAAELEVSVRTVHRDVYALRVAGVPVVTERGIGGGISILGRWRTDLTGLTGQELAALALMADVNPVGRIDEAARTALAKLGTLLPEHLRPQRPIVYLDVDPRSDEAGETQLVGQIEAAIRRDSTVILTLVRAFGTVVTREASPLGLVFSRRAWHLVWTTDDERIRVDQLSSIRAVVEGARDGERPESFDLEGFWNQHRATRDAQTGGYAVRAVITGPSPWRLRDRLDAPAKPGDRPSEVTLQFDSLEQARAEALALGGAIEVIAPEALRRSIADFSEQTLALYG